VLDVLDRNPDVNTVVLLQPTSPLRGDIDISSALAIYRMSGAKTCVSVCEAIQSPYWMFTVSDQLVLEPLSIAGSRILRRQELPVAYSLNGAIYIADAKWLKESRCFVDSNTVAYVMPKSRSIDIDTQEDLELAEFFYRKNKSATS
jgi:N-acylneuraminate cytidylyltransferase